MSGSATTAKPYANAAFETALEAKQLQEWGVFLQQSVLLVQDEHITRLLKDPRVPVDSLLNCFFDLLEKGLNEHRKNFIKLLSEYDRLFLLPEILRLFVELVAEYEKTATVDVMAAMALSQADKQRLVDALEKKLKRKVELHYEIDKDLLAGAVIRIGDSVIDGSMKGRLQKMKEGLLS